MTLLHCDSVGSGDHADNVSILVGYTLLGPLCASRAGASPHTRPILVQGWSPVLAAMVISSMGGKILNTVIARCTSAGCRSSITAILADTQTLLCSSLSSMVWLVTLLVSRHVLQI